MAVITGVFTPYAAPAISGRLLPHPKFFPATKDSGVFFIFFRWANEHLLLAAYIEANQVAFRIATINAAVGQDGRGPTFAAQHLGVRYEFELLG